LSDAYDSPVSRPKLGQRYRARLSATPPRFRNGILASLRGAERASGRGPHASREPRAARGACARARNRARSSSRCTSPRCEAEAPRPLLCMSGPSSDGVEKDGAPGRLYGAEGAVLAIEFDAPRIGEGHQFRLIVSPHHAGELDRRVRARRHAAGRTRSRPATGVGGGQPPRSGSPARARCRTRGGSRRRRGAARPRLRGLRAAGVTHELATDEPRPSRRSLTLGWHRHGTGTSTWRADVGRAS
jgi:hypothetical protein